VLVSIDVTSWYAVVATIVGTLIFWLTAWEKIRDHIERLQARRRAPAADPPPELVVSPPEFDYRSFAGNERRLVQRRYLASLTIGYAIENRDSIRAVTDVETGVRRRDDGRSERFERFRAVTLAAGERAQIAGFDLGREIIDGLAEDDLERAFVLWATYTGPDGARFETTFDPIASDHVTRLATTEPGPRPTGPAVPRPLLVPLGEETWAVGEVEDVGGELMQLPTLPVSLGIANVGDAVALIDEVSASGAGLGTAVCLHPPAVPAGDRVTLRLDFSWLPRLRSGDRLEVVVAYHGPDGREHTPLILESQFLHPNRWRIDRRSPGE
jgi:hypothetical protein